MRTERAIHANYMFTAGGAMLIVTIFFYLTGCILFSGQTAMPIIGKLICFVMGSLSVAALLTAGYLAIIPEQDIKNEKVRKELAEKKTSATFTEVDRNLMRFKVFAATVSNNDIFDAARQLSHRLDTLVHLSQVYPDIEGEVDKLLNVYVSRFMDSADAYTKFVQKNPRWEASSDKLVASIHSLIDIADSILAEKEDEVITDIGTTSTAIAKMAELKTETPQKP